MGREALPFLLFRSPTQSDRLRRVRHPPCPACHQNSVPPLRKACHVGPCNLPQLWAQPARGTVPDAHLWCTSAAGRGTGHRAHRAAECRLSCKRVTICPCCRTSSLLRLLQKVNRTYSLHARAWRPRSFKAAPASRTESASSNTETTVVADSTPTPTPEESGTAIDGSEAGSMPADTSVPACRGRRL